MVAHDWKEIASTEDPAVAPPLQHDTVVAAYLLDPARRGYPLRDVAEEQGLGADVSGGEDPLAEEAMLTRALAERQRAELEELGLMRLLDEVELPLVDVLVEMQREGVKLDVPQVRTIAKRVTERGAASSSARSGSWRARSSRSARPSSWA